MNSSDFSFLKIQFTTLYPNYSCEKVNLWIDYFYNIKLSYDTNVSQIGKKRNKDYSFFDKYKKLEYLVNNLDTKGLSPTRIGPLTCHPQIYNQEFQFNKSRN